MIELVNGQNMKLVPWLCIFRYQTHARTPIVWLISLAWFCGTLLDSFLFASLGMDCNNSFEALSTHLRKPSCGVPKWLHPLMETLNFAFGAAIPRPCLTILWKPNQILWCVKQIWKRKCQEWLFKQHFFFFNFPLITHVINCNKHYRY